MRKKQIARFIPEEIFIWLDLFEKNKKIEQLPRPFVQQKKPFSSKPPLFHSDIIN